MNNKDIKDKAVFVVGLLAAFLAFSAFKDELSKVYILILGRDYSLLTIMILFIVLLALSVYLYALDYLKYSLGKYQNFIIFKCLIPLANFFYFFALILPILMLLIWILGFVQITQILNEYRPIIITLDSILAVIAGVLSVFYAVSVTKKIKEGAILKIENQKNFYLKRAIDLFKNNFYSETLIETQKTLEQYLRQRLLLEKDLTTRYLPMMKLIEYANNQSLLDDSKLNLIRDLQRLRNEVVHGMKSVDREQAQMAINTVRRIIKNEYDGTTETHRK